MFALKCFYAFVHIIGLNDGFQHVIMITILMQFMIFISCSLLYLEHKIKIILELSLD